MKRHVCVLFLLVLLAVFITVGCDGLFNNGADVTITACSVDGASDVLLSQALSLTFSVAMDPSSVEGSFSLTPSTEGVFSWSPDATTLTFNPSSDLLPATQYTVRVSVSATDAEGNALSAEFSAMFTTAGALSAPAGLAPVVGPGYVDLSWSPVAEADSYTVYWSTTSGAGTGGTAVSVTETPFRHEGVSQGQEYFYVVVAHRGTDTSAASTETSASVDVLAAPANPVVELADSSLIISWDPVSLAVAYNLYWSTGSGTGTAGTVIADVTSPYEHTSLSNGETYYYVVTAENPAGEGLACNEVSGVPGTPPAAPANLTATAGLQEVDLSWEPVSGATQHNLYWSTTPDPTVTGTKLSDVSPPYIHSELDNGTAYYYAVVAEDEYGEGPAAEADATAGHILVADVTFPDSDFEAAVLSTGKTYVDEIVRVTANWDNVTDLSGAEYLWQLQEIVLQGNPNLATLDPLASLEHLEEVDASACGSLTDISAVASLPALTYLSLWSCSSLSDISYVSSCGNLERLYLADTLVSDISSVVGLSSLHTLEISGTPLTSTTDLAQLTQLSSLLAGYCSITDFSFLSGFTNLSSLYIDENNLGNLDMLSGAGNLRYLDANDCDLTDISGLTGLNGLRSVALSDNMITDISPLEGKWQIMDLYLDGNSIGSLPDLSGLNSLVGELVLSRNSITDVSPLSVVNKSGLTIDVSDNSITTGVASLVTLTDISSIDFTGNTGIPSGDLDTLEAAIGAEKVIRP